MILSYFYDQINKLVFDLYDQIHKLVNDLIHFMMVKVIKNLNLYFLYHCPLIVLILRSIIS